MFRFANPGQGTKNVVFIATMNGSVYAMDAPSATSPLWQVSLETAPPSTALPNVSDVNPQIGILSTPVIDVSAQVLYVVAEAFESSAPVSRCTRYRCSMAKRRGTDRW